MLKTRSWLPSYSDGVMNVYRIPENRSAFGAQLNPDSPEDLEPAAKLAFKEQVVRAQDFESAEQRGCNMSRKVRTHFAPRLDADCKVVIDGLIYDVSWLDSTASDIYWYLEGGRPIERNEE